MVTEEGVDLKGIANGESVVEQVSSDRHDIGPVLITEGCPACWLSASKFIYFNKLDSAISEQSFCRTPIERSLFLIYHAPARKRHFPGISRICTH